MIGRASGLQKIRFYVSVSAVYALTLLFAAHLLTNAGWMHKKPHYIRYDPQLPIVLTRALVITAGKPVRVTVPRLNIDLPIDDGVYDEANRTWTLSGYRAQFALASVVANDYQGNTFIYGHNNPSVFGKLKQLNTGDTMQLYTDNGYVFNYIYTAYQDLQPNDGSVFRYDGPPTATIQTCSGAWNEFRRMYHFNFQEVQHV
jgi:LPXTG-site transpeptidase (sortase) family protein